MSQQDMDNMQKGECYRLSMDGCQRVDLSKLVQSDECISLLKAWRDGNRVILEPIPAREMWVHDNPEVLASLEEGLTQEAGYFPGSFAGWVDADV